jgi:phenylpropionate dioxygenase-like ring-hydroxylating dioxygenase large terminal subunit
MQPSRSEGSVSATAVDTRTLPERGLSREFYVDEAWFRKELDRLFRKRWLYVGHENQVREAGTWLTFELADDSLFVIRDEDGELRAFHNVCRHRGSRLLTGTTGMCSRSIVCPYHGWSYQRNGALRAAPRMHDGLRTEDLGLHEVHLDIWHGMIFVHLSQQPPERVSEVLDGVDIADYDIAHAKVVRDTTHVVKANWKVLWENGLECYHCALNHPELKKVIEVVRDGPQPSHIESGEFDFRPSYPILPGLLTYSLDGQYKSRCLLGDPGSPPNHATFLQWHTTAFELFASPDNVALTLYKPLAADRTAVRMVLLVHEDAVEGEDFEVAELNELHALVRGQDDPLCETVQKGLTSPVFEPGPFNKDYEFMLQNFTRLYLGAIAERAEA